MSLVKKSAAALYSASPYHPSSLACALSRHNRLPTSSSSIHRLASRGTARQPVQCRCYATVRHDDAGVGAQRQQQSDISRWPKSPNPTPYEILGIRKDAPYTKTRFYQLVKLYHPDTHDHHQRHSPTITGAGAKSAPSPSISQSVRLERYHLVVAANDILSDPSKRRLYDNHGIGWTGGRGNDLYGDRSAREADRSWRSQPGTAAHNATWEDWERWYEERDGHAKPSGSSQPYYMPNGVFAMIVIMMCMVGALAQKTRAENSGTQYVEWSAQQHGAIGNEVRRSTASMAGHSKDQRIESFVKDRENVAFDYVPKKYDRPPSEPVGEPS